MERMEAFARFVDIAMKITLPGPMTIMNSTEDQYYNDEKALGQVLANIINSEIKALVSAGCKCIQVKWSSCYLLSVNFVTQHPLISDASRSNHRSGNHRGLGNFSGKNFFPMLGCTTVLYRDATEPLRSDNPQTPTSR